MLTGRKLLLADDSAAVQKVIELTFADEGMEVVSVGDGQSALEKLEHVTPDVVLADAFMPGLNGYELCRSIKDDERFAQIPVMLLVSSFAPFDEGAAQRAGADDVMTKPFQSIRQLVSRVGSLISGGARDDETTQGHSMLGLGQVAAVTDAAPVHTEPDETNVTVLVEAAQLETAEAHELSGGACAPDIEFQTADTAKLERVYDEPRIEVNESHFEDTMEMEPEPGDADAIPVHAEAGEIIEENTEIVMNEALRTPQQPPTRFDDALLDLDETSFSSDAIAEDVILDLEFEEPPGKGYSRAALPNEVALVTEAAPVAVAEVSSEAPIEAETDQAFTSVDPHPLVNPGAPFASSNPGPLSADAIDAIARRVVERMSDKVVRDIAWEVVPELSELLIKKKLSEQK